MRPQALPSNVFRVSEINRKAGFILGDAFGDVWVEGELSDVTPSRPGHFYFTLNDEVDPAQLRCVMFRSDAQRCRDLLRSGARLKLRGRITIYEPRGTFQMICRQAAPAGEGELAARYARVQAKLRAEGLLDPERKRALPRLPRRVGIVTSLHGAALRDVLRVSAARAPVPIVIADCTVQGEAAPASIVSAIEAIQHVPHIDVLIITRGGGSAEELWAFNEEAVARAIAASRIPTVCGVGHETDITIAELVADVRAATPSNAAEIAVPEIRQLLGELRTNQRGLQRAIEARIDRERLRLERCSRHLLDPRGRLHQRLAYLGQLRRRMHQLLIGRLTDDRRQLQRLGVELRRHRATERLRASRRELHELEQKLVLLLQARLKRDRRQVDRLTTTLLGEARPLVTRRQATLAASVGRLDAMSPLKVLERGYAIALDDSTGKAITDARDVTQGSSLTLRLAHGALRADVVEILDEGER